MSAPTSSGQSQIKPGFTQSKKLANTRFMNYPAVRWCMVSINWRCTVNDPDLPGCDFPENLLTSFTKPKRKPGRPKKISDDMLRRNWGEILFTLEQNWALVGWELQQAETPSDLRVALQCIQGINCRCLELLCLECRRETNIPLLQAVRKRFQEVSSSLRVAQADWRKCRESVELAQSTLSMTLDAQKREELRFNCHETEAALAQANKTLNQFQTSWSQLERALRLREAEFAQDQILDFIKSGRYASTPVTFANAMAGLPVITWRQSSSRCARFKDGASRGLTYKQFLIVKEVFKYPTASAQEAVERMKAHLLHAKGKEVEILKALAENWYYLRRAIDTIIQTVHCPEEALPYRIFAEYQRRSECQNSLDILQAQREVITTPAYLRSGA